MRAATAVNAITTQFTAMACPCVVLVDTPDAAEGARIGQAVKEEALRIEAKYSRYRPSVVTSINEGAGQEVEVDAETADLIDYAVLCHELSDGKFDITSGALRRIWRFDGSASAPSPAQIQATLACWGPEWRSTSGASARSMPWIGRCCSPRN
jgi:FAD:protein FMN transferase